MYLGAILSLCGLIVALISRKSLKDEVLRQDPSLANVDTVVNAAVTALIVTSIIGALLWVWMALANGKGKSWARIVATVLFGLNTIGMISTLVGGTRSSSLSKWVTIASWLVGLLAIVYLYRKESTEFFQRNSRKA